MTSKIIYTGQLRTQATHLRSKTQIQTDAPIDNNGRGESFSPTDLVATALGSCMMTITAIKADNTGWNLENTTIEIEKIMQANPRSIDKIKVNIDFPKTALTEQHATKLQET